MGLSGGAGEVGDDDIGCVPAGPVTAVVRFGIPLLTPSRITYH
jgi:hypothetical protein